MVCVMVIFMHILLYSVCGVIKMTKERIFPLKIGIDGQGVLKELVHKHVTGDQTRIKVLFGLDAELRIVEPFVESNGVYISSNVLCANRGISLQDFMLECKKENKAIFYNLHNLTYVCLQNIVEDKGQIIKNTVNIFIPTGVKKEGLVCKDVSMAFPYNNRSVLASNYLQYSLSRL
jgi:ABC-type Na+ transport system ATPase subunit NatA